MKYLLFLILLLIPLNLYSQQKIHNHEIISSKVITQIDSNKISNNLNLYIEIKTSIITYKDFCQKIIKYRRHLFKLKNEFIEIKKDTLIIKKP